MGAPRRADGVELPRGARRARRDALARRRAAARARDRAGDCPAGAAVRPRARLRRPRSRRSSACSLDGNGASRQRAAFARGGMPAVLAELVEETAQAGHLAVGAARTTRATVGSPPMCRLFGMSGGTREVQATFWLLDAPSSLLLQSESQPDGVGLGTLRRRRRRPRSTASPSRRTAARRSSPARTTSARGRSSRTSATRPAAEPSIENTHPFEQHGRLLGTTASSATSRSCAAGSGATPSSSTARPTRSSTSR